MDDNLPAIAIIGGTGNLGTGLAFQLARKGYPVVIGSREADKAVTAAQEISARLGVELQGLENTAAAAAGEIVILTVPFAHHKSALESVREAVQGKIFVDTTVPLVPPKVMRVQIPPEGAAAVQAQELLGKNVRVVSAFQNVAATHWQEDGGETQWDILVCGNDPQARAVIVELITNMGLRAWHAGPIDNSIAAESLSSVLIFMNRFYKIDGAGLRIMGEPGSAACTARGPRYTSNASAERIGRFW
jgi:NADPH-dependent F420 reductase